jgi:hypothetical protein
VRAIEERFYGRTARSLNVVVRRRPGDTGIPVCVNELSAAAAESVPAHEADDLYSMVRHARIPPDKAREFWRRIEALMREFAQTPRSGETVYASWRVCTRPTTRRSQAAKGTARRSGGLTRVAGRGTIP